MTTAVDRPSAASGRDGGNPKDRTVKIRRSKRLILIRIISVGLRPIGDGVGAKPGLKRPVKNARAERIDTVDRLP
jgi:hypothetical protein